MTIARLANCLCGLLLLVISLSVGCKPDSKPSAPPAATAPPPPPPPPPPLTADEVSARMRPLFVAVYEHGFNPTMLSSPTRSGTAAADASAKTPSLSVLVEKECAKAGIDVAAVMKCAADVQQKLTKRQARDAVLAIYVDQALADADAGNLHRAHVLLSDVLSDISDSQAGDFSASITGLRRFFQEVPDKDRLQAFAQELDSYMRLAEESILLRGEHAAVLHAAGLVDAAEFTRSKLLTQFNLVTLPLIDLAIARGESYGFRAPDQLQETRRRLDSHAAALAGNQPEAGGDAFRTEANWGTIEQSRAALLEAFAKDAELVAAGHPVRFDSGTQAFVLDDAKVLADPKRLQAVADWCGGKPAEGIDDGTGHFLLGWHWLANKRPGFARAAFVAGAQELLDRAKSVAIEPSAGGQDADSSTLTKALVSQFNAYRLLMAASLITASPPGAHVDSRDSNLPQLEVLLVAWKQAWLKGGLPQKPADAMITQFVKASEQHRRRLRDQITAEQPIHRSDRYFFFDYRFSGNGVPDVVLAKASADELVENARVPELATTERFLEFVKGFQKPREFSKGFAARWATKK